MSLAAAEAALERLDTDSGRYGAELSPEQLDAIAAGADGAFVARVVGGAVSGVLVGWSAWPRRLRPATTKEAIR